MWNLASRNFIQQKSFVKNKFEQERSWGKSKYQALLIA